MAGQLQASRAGNIVFAEDIVNSSRDHARLLAGQNKLLNTNNAIAKRSLATLNKLQQTNDEIARSNRAIEAYSERIAAAAERQNDISERQLAEAERQTAISQQQLELAKVAELERRRQIEIKQAAFALNEAVKDGASSSDAAYFMALKFQKLILQDVGLSADEAHEIADKEYVKGALLALDDALSEVGKRLGEEADADFDRYLSLKGSIDDMKSEIERLTALVSGNFNTSEGEAERALSLGFILKCTFLPFVFVADAVVQKAKDDGKKPISRVGALIVFGFIWFCIVGGTGGAALIATFALSFFANAVRNKSVRMKNADREHQEATYNARQNAAGQKVDSLTASLRECDDFFAYFEDRYGLA